MQIALFILGLACLIYYVVLVNIGMDFSIIWLLGAVAFLGIWWWLRYGRNWTGLVLPAAVKVILAALIAIGLFLFLVVEGFICSGIYEKPEENPDYVLILGAQVHGETPSRALTRRLQAAEKFLSVNPRTKAILSGGKGNGEDITEAEAMSRYLVNAGIEKERLLMEDKSTSTLENLAFTAELLKNKKAKIVVVTNNFHIFRALALGKKMGFDSLTGLPAESDPRYQVHYLVREFFAVLKEKAVGNI